MRIKSAYKENLGDVDMSKCQSKGPYFKGSDGTEKFRIRFYIESIKIEWEYPSKEARDKELAAIDKICKVIDLGEKKPEEICKELNCSGKDDKCPGNQMCPAIQFTRDKPDDLTAAVNWMKKQINLIRGGSGIEPGKEN